MDKQDDPKPLKLQSDVRTSRFTDPTHVDTDLKLTTEVQYYTQREKIEDGEFNVPFNEAEP